MKKIFTFFFSLFLLTAFFSCSSQSDGNEQNAPKVTKVKNNNQNVVKSNTKVSKAKVNSVKDIEWQILLPTIHPASWERNNQPQPYEKMSAFGFSLGSFKIINNGTICAKGSDSKLYFSKDEGKNWYQFEPKLEDGKTLSVPMYQLYYTADYFVLVTGNYKGNTDLGSFADEITAPTYISNDGAIWKDAKTVNFDIRNYVWLRNSPLFKKTNPDIFKKIWETRPTNFQMIVYNIEKQEATIYEKDFKIPDNVVSPKKKIFEVCDSNFVLMKRDGIFRGKSLKKFTQLEYNIHKDVIQMELNPFPSQFGCHLISRIAIRDEESRQRTLVPMVLYNSPERSSQLEIVKHQPASISSSKNGDVIIAQGVGKANPNSIFINKNSLNCHCMAYQK